MLNIIQAPSPNFFDSYKPILAVCLHGTAGPLAASLATLRNPRPDKPSAAVSSNYLIDLDGTVYELVPYPSGKRAWANGIVEAHDTTIEWLNQCVKTGSNPNLCTVSIEHVATADAMRRRASMPVRQFDASIELTASILLRAGLKASHQTIIGHNQISGTIKYDCPGVIFPPAYTEIVIDRHKELG